MVEQRTADPLLQQFSKEQLQSRAEEFMRIQFGPCAALPTMAEKREYHEAHGLLLLYISHLWKPFS